MVTSNQIKQKIIAHLGFFPSFLASAIETPTLLASFWAQTVSTYINNPLPELFKEKLFVLLSRGCSTPYFVICHSCNLRSLGMTAKEILELNKLPLPQQARDIKLDLEYLSKQSNLHSYWQSNSQLEKSLLRCAVLIFTQPFQAKNCCLKLQEYLGIIIYNHLIALLSYIQFCHQWIESHPSISHEQDRRSQLHLAPLLLEELDLADCFKANPKKLTSSGQVDSQQINSLTLNSLVKSKQVTTICQERFKNCFFNAPFPMMIYSSEGKVLHLNKNWIETTGYSIEEVPTIAEWKRRSQIKQQEIMRSANGLIETEVAFEGVVNSLLNLPYDVDIKIDNGNIAITTRSEVTITTSNGDRRFWDFYSAPLSRFTNGTELMISMAKDITTFVHAEADLAETERTLQLVLETSKSGIWNWDINTNLVTIYDFLKSQPFAHRASSILGSNHNSFKGGYESFLDLTHPSDRQAINSAAIKAVTDKQELALEYRLIWSDKSVHWVRIQAKPVCNISNQVIRVTGIITNITREKQTVVNLVNNNFTKEPYKTKSLSLLPTIIESIPYYILVINREDRRISFCNRLLADSLGFSNPQQVEGKTITECFPPSYAEYISQQNDLVFSTAKTVHKQETVSLADGNHNFDTFRIPLLNSEGKVDALLCTASDVPNLVNVKQVLSERTVQLEAANRELESFSYSVSHDLQAPLRVINGFSQVLWEQYAPQLDKQGQHYLQRIKANSERMSELIDALLQLSRVARSQMQNIPVDLSAIAIEIAEELKTNEPERQVKFRITPELIANGDSRLLRIVLNNLLHNAWKYTSKREKAIIEFDGVTRQDGKKTYLVKDNGVGFANDYKDKLFIPFQRLHLETEFPGMGIGLATVQRIIYRHGGQVWAEGELNQGATFYFSL